MSDILQSFRVASIAKALACALVSAAALTACAPSAPDAPTADPQAPSPAPAAAPVDAPVAAPASDAAGRDTTGGDGSEIRLDVLTEADMTQAALAGELACSFTEAGAQPLLLAKGDVGSDSPAQGVVKVAGYVEPVRAPGGFNGMTRDPTFTGQGKTVRIEETGEAVGGGESPPRPATLTYLRADGASRSIQGQWQCGP
ncbi:hypothetical protein AO715_04115 [Xanthomonas sp. Mitacek01]|nr:hypothetical protein AO715_04115 [Xanthomonas sp. Mitacek01]